MSPIHVSECSRRLLLVAFVFFGMCPFAAGQSATSLPLHVHIKPLRESEDSYVSFRLPSVTRLNLRVVETTNGSSACVSQVDPSQQRIWWLASGKLVPGSTRTFRIEEGEGPKTTGVEVDVQPRYVEVRRGTQKLLRYNTAHVEPPDGVDPAYGRSAHIHPVWSLGGAIVTDEFPEDHLHQSGVFSAYTRAEFEGHQVDFWNLKGGQGRVRFRSLIGTASGPILGLIRAEHEHVDLTVSGGRVVLLETWELRVWNPVARRTSWAFDIHSVARCATGSPLQLPEYHYGGMALRAAGSWKVGAAQIATSEGHDRIAGNHTRPRWCYMGGSIDGKPAGITLFTHPKNFRYPEPLRIHPTMPYMVYTPSFLGDWSIEPGRPHTANYRFAVHDGPFAPNDSTELGRDFSELIEAIQVGGS